MAQIWVKCARTGCELGLIWWRYKSFSQSMWISQICLGVFWKLLFIKKQSIVNPKKTVNPKYYVKSLERNKVRLSDIRELWKKEKYSEENSDNTLTDIAIVDFRCASLSSQ